MSSGKSKSVRRSSQTSSSKTTQSGPSAGNVPPTSSFLFAVNTLQVNDDAAPRADPDGHWLPPMSSTGFGAQMPGQLYRWGDGQISAANSNYRIWDGNWWFTGDPQQELTQYSTATTFFCNRFHQFLIYPGDASVVENIEEEEFPNNRWYPLNFTHDNGLSRIYLYLAEPTLASPGGHWVRQLGLETYDYQNPDPDSDNPPPLPPLSEGLAGSLSVLIALIAFSCNNNDLNNVFIDDRAWRRYQWRGHNRSNGRRERRGKVVTIFLDPENPQGSTLESIYALEWSGGGMLQGS